jgi:hypothetical protein
MVFNPPRPRLTGHNDIQTLFYQVSKHPKFEYREQVEKFKKAAQG